jgi:hypothetical protein
MLIMPLRDVNFVAINVGQSSWLMPRMTLNVNRYGLDSHRLPSTRVSQLAMTWSFMAAPQRIAAQALKLKQAPGPTGPTLYGELTR